MKCPKCFRALPDFEVKGGWCEGCGAKLPLLLPTGEARPDPPAVKQPDHEVKLSGCIWVVCILVCIFGYGVWMAQTGWRDLRLALTAPDDAADCRIEDLEEGRPPSGHVRIGRHVCLYPHHVFSPLREADTAQLMLPIYSVGHPAYRDWRAAREEDAEARPDRLRVVLRTRKYGNRTQIPPWTAEEETLTAAVIGGVDRISPEEAGLLREAFPGASLKDVIVIDEVLPPPGQAWALGRLVLGPLLMLFVIWLVVTMFRAPKEK